MTHCENKDICCYFHNTIAEQPALKDKIEGKYCAQNKDKCARYQIKSKVMKGYVLPDDHALDRVGKLLTDLRPGDMGIANRIIATMVH